MTEEIKITTGRLPAGNQNEGVNSCVDDLQTVLQYWSENGLSSSVQVTALANVLVQFIRHGVVSKLQFMKAIGDTFDNYENQEKKT